MKSRKGWHFVTEDEFAQIKSLIGMGLTGKRLRVAANRPSATLYRIIKANDFNSYREATKAEVKRLNAENGKRTKAAPVVPTFVNTNDETLRVLTRIADTLEKLEEHWRPLPGEQKKKFGLF